LNVSISGQWTFSVGYDVKKSGSISILPGQWHSFQMTFYNSNIYSYLDGVKVASVMDSTFEAGWAALGSSFDYVQFDNFSLIEVTE